MQIQKLQETYIDVRALVRALGVCAWTNTYNALRAFFFESAGGF